MTVAQLVADRLAGAGARFAFTVPGESFLPLLDTLPAAGIRVVGTRHEGGAAFMAAAAAHLTGKPQIVLATRTVGAANAAIGIHTARQDSTQLVALIGGVRREFRGRESFQESDLATGIGSLAAWSVELERPNDAGRVMGEAMRHLTTGRPGPIMLTLPEDILESTAVGHAAASATPRPVHRRTAPPCARSSSGSRRHAGVSSWPAAVCCGHAPASASSPSRMRSRCPSSRPGVARTSCPTTIPGTWA